MVWDITRIAAQGTPEARELIYDVILASTAIPGAFPPVMIEVEAEGRRQRLDEQQREAFDRKQRHVHDRLLGSR